MNETSLSAEDSNRICNHMNEGHKDALIAYAKFYAGIEDPINIKLLEINQNYMSLSVDEKNIRIRFDHSLKDSSDAHKTLVSMLKEIPK